MVCINLLSFSSPYVYDCLLSPLSYLLNRDLASVYAFVAFLLVSGSNTVSEHILCASWGTCTESDRPFISEPIHMPVLPTWVCVSWALPVSGLSHCLRGACGQ